MIFATTRGGAGLDAALATLASVPGVGCAGVGCAGVGCAGVGLAAASAPLPEASSGALGSPALVGMGPGGELLSRARRRATLALAACVALGSTPLDARARRASTRAMAALLALVSPEGTRSGAGGASELSAAAAGAAVTGAGGATAR